MAYTSPPKTWVAADVLTAAQLNTYLRDTLEALFPVGASIYLTGYAGTSVETIINGIWLEQNGVAVSRSTYADLNTLYSGVSYPFGSGNGTTTFNTLDLRGRGPLGHPSSSGHADIKTLGATDGAALANRSPKHSHTFSLTAASHTHSIPLAATFTDGPGSGGTLAKQGSSSTGASGSLSTSGTVGLSGRQADTAAFGVGGIWVVKAFT